MSSAPNGLKRDASQYDTPPSNKPTKIRRALAACKNCRKQKTRCDHGGGAPCHRCKVLALDCEFDSETIQGSGIQSAPGSMPTMIPSPGSVTGDVVPAGHRMDRFESRMERMERSIHELIAALNPNAARSQPQPVSSPFNLNSNHGQQGGSGDESEEEDDNGTRPTGNTDVSEEQSPAPVEIIRDLASEFLDGQSPKARNKYPALGSGDDIVSKGIVPESQAQELVDIFLREYGKWLGFPPVSNLLKHWRVHSPLLLAATCLIASRHLPFSSSLDPLVTALFAESRRLLSLSLLNVPRNVETLQAILILSVWSPLARREKQQDRPLSGARTLDSWLVSGYGVMLGMTVIRFNDLTRSVAEFKGPRTPVGGQSRESADGISQRLRVWNHLCLIHLHYCVGTRRPCIIEPSLLERCRAILNVDGVEPSNHDRRMVAEINLYSKLYGLLQRVTTRARGTEDGGELQAWREEWDYLFHVDGHQYIEIGYYFAHLMLHSQALKLLESGGRATPDSSPAPGTPSADPIEQKKSHMSAISQLSTQILQRAHRVEVAEIRHVTDIIYFILAFAGVSLCRLLPSILIFGPVKAEEYRATLNATITEAVEWLRAVAISEEHIAFKFSEIIGGLHNQTLRREQRRNQSSGSLSVTPTEATPSWPFSQQPPSSAPNSATGFAQPFPPTPTYHVMPESPHGTAGFSPFSSGVTYPQQGFGQNTGYDESYFVGLFPELMGPGFIDGGYAAGLGQGAVSGSGGFEDSLGFWGFRNS